MNNPKPEPGTRATANKYGLIGALIGALLGLLIAGASLLWGTPAGAYLAKAHVQVLFASGVEWVVWGVLVLGIGGYIAGLIRAKTR